MAAPTGSTRLAILTRACARVGLPAPRARQRSRTWARACVEHVAQPGLTTHWEGEGWVAVAREHLDAAWEAARDADLDECVRLLHGARTMIRVGNEHLYADDTGNDSALDSGLPAIVESFGRRPEGEAGMGLVVYAIAGDGASAPEWFWGEGIGLCASGYVIDDGRWREAFDDDREACDAASTWWTRARGPGRGLAYLDTPELQRARSARAADPRTPASEFLELAWDPCLDVVRAVVENASAPAAALVRVAGGPWDSASELAERRGLPDEAVLALLARADETITPRLVRAGHAHPALLAAFAEDEEAQCRVAEDDLAGVAPGAIEILRDAGLLDDDPEDACAARPDRGRAEGVLRRSYTIAHFVAWDHEVDAFANDFRATFHVYPNILLASEVTYARIDIAAKKENIRSTDGERPSDGEHSPIGSFHGSAYELVFAVEDALPVGRVSLLYDGDPGGGGEDVPDEDTVVQVGGLRRTA